MHGLETIVAMNQTAASPQIYRAFSLKDGTGQWGVLRLDYGRRVFYGSKRECREWIERNGHDTDV